MWTTLLLSLSAAELIISHKDGSPFIDQELDIVKALQRRLLKVQWPTVIAYFGKTKDEDHQFVTEFKKCLDDGQKSNCPLIVGKTMLPEDSVYQIEWVPDTVFQLSVLVGYLQRLYKGLPEKPQRPTLTNFVHLNDIINKDLDSLQEFLDGCMTYNFDSEFIDAHLDGLAYLQSHYRDRTDWLEMADQLFREFASLWPDNIKYKGGQNLLDAHIAIIKSYLNFEISAAEHNMLILSRGTKQVLSSVDGESFLMYDFPNPDYSISFGQRILDGTMRDCAAETGARSLTYFVYDNDRALGYILQLPMNDYANGLIARLSGETKSRISSFNVLYIPPISAVGGLFGMGEVFHPRNKLGPGTETLGFNGLGKPEKAMKSDSTKKLSIFREQDFSYREYTIRLMDIYMHEKSFKFLSVLARAYGKKQTAFSAKIKTAAENKEKIRVQLNDREKEIDFGN